MNILISGIGGDIGLGIARILATVQDMQNLHGIDIHTDHPGALFVKRCSVAPKASDQHYIDWLEEYITKHNIDLFIPSSEAEIIKLADNDTMRIASAKVLRNTNFTVYHSHDKHKCLEYLSSCDIPVPRHGLVGGAVPSVFPVVVKPRFGQGSKGIKIISDTAGLKQCDAGDVWQDYLVPDDQEFTCAIYGSPLSGYRTLSMKRTLTGGMTTRGMIVNNEVIKHYLYAVIDKMNICGSINIQLRLTSHGSLLFEINPRLSSTLVFRHKLGFCDLVWWIKETMGHKIPEYRPPLPGTSFYRGSDEFIIYPD